MKIHREPAYSAGFHFEGPYSSIQALWQNGASHPKTQFIPGTASSILGGQIVRFLLPSLGGGDTIAPLFIFDLHPPQNRQTDSFMLNNLLETEKSNRNGSMHTQHNSKEKTRDKHFLKLRSIDGSSIDKSSFRWTVNIHTITISGINQTFLSKVFVHSLL